MTLFPLANRKLFLVVVIALLTACGGGGGGGGNKYPTPTLPAGARTINVANADETASSAASFVSTTSAFTALKTNAPPSMAQVIELVRDQVIKRNRNARPAASLKTEDLSSYICYMGTAIANYDQGSSSESGRVTFSICDIGFGIVIDGVVVYDGSWNDSTLDYSLHIGGTLSVNDGGPLTTLVMNLTETGNDGTGGFNSNISFSVDGIPGGGYLVTTPQLVVGDYGGLASGLLMVTGSASSRLRITVIGPFTASVEYDDGSGIFLLAPTTPITLDF
jgi:hypothetical protein